MSLEALRQQQDDLVRKVLDGALFRAPMSAPHISAATLFAPDGEFLELPEGWADLGLLNTDGMGHSRAVTSSETPAFGRTSPVRSDVSTDTDTMSVVAIETKLSTIELGTGSVILPGARDATNGSLEIKKPPRPTPRQYRFFSVAKDETAEGDIYICKYMPKGKIGSYGDQAMSVGDDAFGWPATVTGQVDETWGASGSWIFGGPGWNARLEAMGFSPLVP